nr:EAL domain-containing protein [Salinibacillus kushneri]
MGEWVLREACKHSKKFRDHNLMPFPISVNISTKQLMNPNFISRLKQMISEEQMNPPCLPWKLPNQHYYSMRRPRKILKS